VAAEHHIGTPTYFGQSLRALRSIEGKSQREWATAAGMDPSVLSRYEKGELGPPPRQTLIGWMESWTIPYDRQDDLMIAAGYLPEIGPTLSTDERGLLTSALRELLVRPGTPADETGFMAALRRLLKGKLPDLDTSPKMAALRARAGR
jgi:transcriptional regulator with XRE-family HTH domain